ncbi:MAG: tRNA pseudouridine(13) synthase TruD [Candidatus Micrarchaeaceae archaeon]
MEFEYSEHQGIGGRYKEKPEDFIVKEILGNGVILELGKSYAKEDICDCKDGKFCWIVFEKRAWSSSRALYEIAKRAGRGRRSISFAGSKDRNSISVQLGSIYGASPEKVLSQKIKDIRVYSAWLCDKPVELGSNIGNSFEAIVRNIERNEAPALSFIPNFFDKQRFGNRLNNAKIGLMIMKGDLQGAVEEFLLSTENENSIAAIEARNRLKAEMDYKEANAYFPRFLKEERAVISWLSTHEKDYAGALRRLPRSLLIMFIHAVEAEIFNYSLRKRLKEKDFSSRIKCGAGLYGFPDTEKPGMDYPLSPLIGYNTKDEYIGPFEEEAMEKLQVSKEEFKIKRMPELGMKGSFRPLFVNVADFSCEFDEDSAKIKFMLPSGSYATMLLEYVCKGKI